jgi:hypothetical protein
VRSPFAGGNYTLKSTTLLINFAQKSKREYGKMVPNSTVVPCPKVRLHIVVQLCTEVRTRVREDGYHNAMDEQTCPFCNQPMKAHPDRPPRMMADSRALNLQRKRSRRKKLATFLALCTLPPKEGANLSPEP